MYCMSNNSTQQKKLSLNSSADIQRTISTINKPSLALACTINHLNMAAKSSSTILSCVQLNYFIMWYEVSTKCLMKIKSTHSKYNTCSIPF